MAKTSLILTTTDILGRKQQKSFTDINPEADTAALKTFAQMCNNLTTNTYIQTDRIDKINCDTEAGTSKTTPTFTANKTTFSKAAAGPSNSQRTDDGWIHDSTMWRSVVTITYNGDGALSVTPVSGVTAIIEVETVGSVYLIVFDIETSATFPKTITIGTTETDTYKAATPITITLTA